MAIAPDDSDSRLRARISLSPSYATAAEEAANKAVADANALVNKALGATVTSMPAFNPPTFNPAVAPTPTPTQTPTTRVAANQAKKDAGPPYTAPAGTPPHGHSCHNVLARWSQNRSGQSQSRECCGPAP